MNHYTVTALPGLPELGGTPPLAPRQLLEHVRESKRAHAAVRLLLLGQDLRLRDAFLSGEVKQPEPSVLTVAQVRAEAPLPLELEAELKDATPQEAMDATWAAYFRHLAERAAALPSPFLAAWVRYEVGLRNALAQARALALGLDATSAQVERHLADDAPDLSALVRAWSGAPNQLAALRLLDNARLAWIRAMAPHFSFHDDELVAWAAQLLLVQRWHRLGAVPETSAPPQPSQVQGAPP